MYRLLVILVSSLHRFFFSPYLKASTFICLKISGQQIKNRTLLYIPVVFLPFSRFIGLCVCRFILHYFILLVELDGDMYFFT